MISKITNPDFTTEEKKMAVISIIVASIILYLPGRILPHIVPHFNFSIDGVMLVIITTIAMHALLVIILICLNRKRLLSDFKEIKVKTIVIALIATVLALVCNFATHIIFTDQGSNQEAANATVEASKWLMLIPTVFLAPFGEELYTRLSFRALCKNPVIYVIISAFAFWLLHETFTIGGISYFLLGIIWAAAYVKSKNIFTTVIAHFLNNAISFSLMAFAG